MVEEATGGVEAAPTGGGATGGPPCIPQRGGLEGALLSTPQWAHGMAVSAFQAAAHPIEMARRDLRVLFLFQRCPVMMAGTRALVPFVRGAPFAWERLQPTALRERLAIPLAPLCAFFVWRVPTAPRALPHARILPLRAPRAHMRARPPPASHARPPPRAPWWVCRRSRHATGT